MLRISDSIKKYFTELGTQGSIMNLRYKELLRELDLKGEIKKKDLEE